MVKSKSKATNYPVPQDDSEARTAIVELGVQQRQLIRKQADLADEISALKDRYGQDIEPINSRITELQAGLQTFAEANRARLTRDGKTKTIKFTTGELSWRHRPAKVTLRKVEEVIEAISAAGLARKFLRTKKEVNKEAMLADREKAAGITGVTIGSDGEDFIVTPDTDAVEEALA